MLLPLSCVPGSALTAQPPGASRVWAWGQSWPSRTPTSISVPSVCSKDFALELRTRPLCGSCVHGGLRGRFTVSRWVTTPLRQTARFISVVKEIKAPRGLTSQRGLTTDSGRGWSPLHLQLGAGCWLLPRLPEETGVSPQMERSFSFPYPIPALGW